MDCIDVYKQLAFDHPVLKNHKFQVDIRSVDDANKTLYLLKFIGSVLVKPTSILVEMRNEELTTD